MGHGSEVPGLFSDFALRLSWQPHWLIKHAQRRWGRAGAEKTCSLQGRGGVGGGGCTLNIGKQRDLYTPITLRLTQTHHPPTEVSPAPCLSLSLLDQAHCHPAPIQNSSGKKELITASWMRKNGVWLDVLRCKWSQHTPDKKLDYRSLLRHPLYLILFISSSKTASY